MTGKENESRSWRRTGLLLICVVAGPPALFVLLSPALAFLGYATGWFAPEPVGNAAGLILLGAIVVVVFAAAVLAVAAAALAVIGTTVATIVSAIAHVFARLR